MPLLMPCYLIPCLNVSVSTERCTGAQWADQNQAAAASSLRKICGQDVVASRLLGGGCGGRRLRRCGKWDIGMQAAVGGPRRSSRVRAKAVERTGTEHEGREQQARGGQVGRAGSRDATVTSRPATWWKGASSGNVAIDGPGGPVRRGGRVRGWRWAKLCALRCFSDQVAVVRPRIQMELDSG
ncbi:hypothetical protein B0H16DRAFT_1468824 [Mycena metata]|uniref:Uncharacterized protein n=1 Tax=Mycena metata TaxID=1033252 RepID=A0AAD7MT38_9AGAR|nr:hypothetical protein B0H16DRAFT_1468824 [Mycena metata]